MADGFLGRWSRRKQDVREGRPVVEPPPPVAPPSVAVPAAVGAGHAASTVPGAPLAAAQAPDKNGDAAVKAQAPPPPAPTLEQAQALTSTSDFKPFISPSVSPEVRNLAMKKLFADPHFNVMDGLDIYIGDYTQPDPLPEGMLRKLASAHTMGFFDGEKNEQAAQDVEVPAAGAGPIAPDAAPHAAQPAHPAHPALAASPSDLSPESAGAPAQSVHVPEPELVPRVEPVLAHRTAQGVEPGLKTGSE